MKCGNLYAGLVGPGSATVAGLWGIQGLAEVLAIAMAFGIAVAAAITLGP